MSMRPLQSLPGRCAASREALSPSSYIFIRFFVDKISLISFEYKEGDRFHHRHDGVYADVPRTDPQHSILGNKYVRLTFAFMCCLACFGRNYRLTTRSFGTPYCFAVRVCFYSNFYGESSRFFVIKLSCVPISDKMIG